jgi:hypothetical protein
MCYERWVRRQRSDRAQESGWIWDEFERTEPLSNAETGDDEAEITLEQREPDPVAAER